MVIEEPLNVPRRPPWLKITFTCFILIIGVSVVSIGTKSQHTRNEILVLPRSYEGWAFIPIAHFNDWKCTKAAKSLYIINPFSASNDGLFKRFKLSFETEPKFRHHTFCSVVWKNSILMFGGSTNALTSEDVNARQVTMLTGCKVKHFEQALPSMISDHGWFDGFEGVCTTVQDKIMLCFGISENLKQCRQLEIGLIGRNFTSRSFKNITESLFFHGAGTNIATINGCLTFVI